VLECLKDRETERPSSKNLCRRLAALKKSPEYVHNFHKDSPSVSLRNQKETNQELARELHKLRQKLTQAKEEKKEMSQQLAQANQELQEKLAQANQEKEEKSQQLAQANQEPQEKLAQANQELQEKSQQLAQENQEKEERVNS